MESEILSQAAMANETPGADVNNSPGPKAHPQIETAEEEPRRGGKKRSKLACRNCRRRKVRCDVHPHGAPCTNCRLDSVECAPCEKRTRGCIKNKRQTSKQTAIVPSPEQATSSSPADSLGECHEASLNTENDARLASLEEAWFHEHRRSSLSLPSENNPETGVDGAQGLWRFRRLISLATCRYLTCDMSRVSAEDYSYLKQKGSFSLPKRDVLEDLLECYFDYIHPTMPFIDETEFWEIYHGRDADGQPSPPSHRTRISWLIFQAMLFAATTCASPELLRRAGYTSRMVARREAFFKVRTLYSLDIERDKMVLLQTFLLMSYWRGDAGEDKDAWHWSGLALSRLLAWACIGRQAHRSLGGRKRCAEDAERRPPRIQLDEFDVPLLTLADYNVGLRSPICKLSSGEELGKRTTLSMTLHTSLLDTLQVQGPNGGHTCLVTAAASGSLSRSKRDSVSVPLDLHVARAIAEQLVLAVAYLHGNGVIHGDLHLGNILLTAPRGFELLCDEELREGWGGNRRESKLKPTTTSHFWTASAFPSLATLPAFFGGNSDDISLSDAAILLTDFGTFFCPSQETRFTFPIAPHCLRSRPLPVQYGAVIGQRSLFETYFCSNDRTTAQPVEALGRLPPERWAWWETRSKYFTEDSQLLRNRRVASLDAEFDSAIQNGRKELGQEMVSMDEKGAFMTMIRPMLECRPEKRCTVNETLQSEWMTKWAMLDFKRMRKELAAKKEVQ
ncbi:Cutinase transcription factor 1 beta like protein [Verticillium longisporum]|nr:Cutinase transcription factor 1 beta like protein [Verticillium longisporum]